MAKSKLKVRRVTSRDERKSPSVYTRLKTDEQFRAHALFEPDPELESNPGFYEFFRHNDQQLQRYVPCTGDSCPYCMANDNPWTAALTLWYYPDNDKREQLKVFTMNNQTTEDMADTAEEEDGILGKKFRVKRMSDKGNYKIVPLSDKRLTKKQIEKLLGEAPDLEELVLSDAKRQLERAEALGALSDDDDDDDDGAEEETEKPKSRRGRPKAAVADEEEDDDEDEEEDEEEDEDEADEEEEADDEEEEEEDAEAEDEDEGENLADAELKIVATHEQDEYITVTDGDEEFDVWNSDEAGFDWDALKKGTKIIVSADKDDEGDFVATSLEIKKAASRNSGGGRKSGAKGRQKAKGRK